MIINQTYISHSDIHGYGVFAVRDIKTGDIIIQHPCVPIQSRRPIPLEIATHMFGTSSGIAAVFENASFINGAGSKLNKNVKFEFDTERGIVNIKALQAISKNEELLLNY